MCVKTEEEGDYLSYVAFSDEAVSHLSRIIISGLNKCILPGTVHSQAQKR